MQISSKPNHQTICSYLNSFCGLSIFLFFPLFIFFHGYWWSVACLHVTSWMVLKVEEKIPSYSLRIELEIPFRIKKITCWLKLWADLAQTLMQTISKNSLRDMSIPKNLGVSYRDHRLHIQTKSQVRNCT